MQRKYGVELSSYRIKTFLKEDGYNWRVKKRIQSYVNREINVSKRRTFAQQLIQCLEAGINVVNIDESGFNCTSNAQYGWVKKGEERRSLHQ
jgi:hypothetical protein